MSRNNLVTIFSVTLTMDDRMECNLNEISMSIPDVLRIPWKKFFINHKLIGSFVIEIPKKFSVFYFMKAFYILCKTS